MNPSETEPVPEFAASPLETGWRITHHDTYAGFVELRGKGGRWQFSGGGADYETPVVATYALLVSKGLLELGKTLRIRWGNELIGFIPPNLVPGKLEVETPEMLPAENAPTTPEIAALAQPGIVYAKLSQFVKSGFNPRTEFDQTALEELAASIRARGILQNLVARVLPTTGRLEIAAGERRYRAAMLNVEMGFWTLEQPIPVSIQELSDLEMAVIAAVENDQREGLDAIDQARGFAQIRDLGMDAESIALSVGLTLETVKRRLAIADHLHGDVTAAYRAEHLTLAQLHAFTIASHAQQLKTLEAMKASNWAKLGFEPDALRARFSRESWQVRYAAFPLERYTGGLSQPDLFGSTPQYFLDQAQAKRLQIEALTERLNNSGVKHTSLLFQNNLKLPPTHELGANTNDNTTLVLIVDSSTGQWAEYHCKPVAKTAPKPAREEPSTSEPVTTPATPPETTQPTVQPETTQPTEAPQPNPSTSVPLEQPTRQTLTAHPGAGVFSRLASLLDDGDKAMLDISSVDGMIRVTLSSLRGDPKAPLRIVPFAAKGTALEFDAEFAAAITEFTPEQIAALEAAKPAPPPKAEAVKPAPKPAAKKPESKPAPAKKPAPKAVKDAA